MEFEFLDKNSIFGIVWVLQANTILQNQIIIKTVKATKKLEAAESVESRRQSRKQMHFLKPISKAAKAQPHI